MRLNRAIDDSAHRLAARRVDGRLVAARLIAVEGERMLERARGRLVDWLVGQACPRWAGAQVPGTVAGQAGMICAFVLAGRLGWAGPWRALVEERLGLLLARGNAVSAQDRGVMARALALGGRALGREDLVAMSVEPQEGRARQGDLAGHAQAVVEGMARWRRRGQVADMRAVLVGVAGLEMATEGALPGMWQGGDGAVDGGDLWCFARAAAALNGEDRLWLCP